MAEKALLPLFPLDVVLLPGEKLALHIFEPRYRTMVSKAHADGSEFGVLRQSGDKLERAGCAAKVRKVTDHFEDGRFNIRAMGTRRFVVRALDSSEECLQGAIEFFDDDTPAQADASKVQAMLDVAVKVRRLTGTATSRWDPNHPWLSFRIAGDLPVAADMKQKLLGLRSEIDRVELLTGYLRAVIGKRQRREKREQSVRGNGRLRH